MKIRRFCPLTSVALLIFALLIANGAMLLRQHAREVPVYDLIAFYAAGRIVSLYGPARLYDLDIQKATHRRVLGASVDRLPLCAYLNPPFVAPLFAPLALLSYQSAYVAMGLLNILLLAAALTIATRGQPPGARAVCLVGTLAAAPAFSTLRFAQLSGLMLLVFALFLRDLTRGNDRRAGVWLALLLVKPQLLVAPVILLAWKRRWGTLGVAAACAAVLGIVSFAMVGTAGVADYWRLAGLEVTNDAGLAVAAPAMHNWRGAMTRAGLGVWAWPAAALASGATLGVLLRIWWGPWRPDGPGLAALVLATLLVSPHCHEHDYVLAGLAMAALAPLAAERPTMWLAAACFALATWVGPWVLGSASVLHATAVAVLLGIGFTASRGRGAATDLQPRVGATGASADRGQEVYA
jgi:hypothetical protein